MNAKENTLRAIRRDHPQWVPNGMEAIAMLPSPIVERPSRAGVDAFGVRWDYDEKAQGGTYPAHGGHVFNDIADWRTSLRIPDVDAIDWAARAREAQAVNRNRYLVSGFIEMGLFERSYLLMGMENALVSYLTDTGEMRAMLGALADYKIALIERYIDECHPDIIWYGDDWGTQSNLFMPVDIWRATVMPETRRIYECILRRGVIVNQHSCGKVDSIFSDIVDMGATMFNPCQPCNDLAALKRAYGEKICFVGGIDSQHVLDRMGATPGEVTAEVAMRIRTIGECGGYIAMPSHSVPYDEALLMAMNDAIRDYGQYLPDGSLARFHTS